MVELARAHAVTGLAYGSLHESLCRLMYTVIGKGLGVLGYPLNFLSPFSNAPPEPSIDLSSYRLVLANGGSRSFDVDLAGERLLVARPLPREDRLVVVLDWFEELERLAPTTH